MSFARLEIIEDLEAIYRGQRFGESRECESGDWEGIFGVIDEELQQRRISFKLNGRRKGLARKGEERRFGTRGFRRRRFTFLISRVPMKAVGFPGSWIGMRE